MIEIEPGLVWSEIRYDTDGASPLKNVLNSGLKVDAPGAKFLWAYKSGQWDGKVALWNDYEDPITQQHTGVIIRTGLVPKLTTLLNKGGIPWKAGIDHRKLPINYKLSTTNVPLRKYQFNAVRAAFRNRVEPFGWWPQGVLSLACGAGKTECAVAMYEMNPVSTIFLVHTKDLMIQAQERFEKYGHMVGLVGDGNFEPDQRLTVSTMQTIYSILQDEDTDRYKKLMSWINNTEQMFMDECHLLAANVEKGNQFVQIADMIPAKFRWGLTATPFMRSQYDNLLLESVTGSAIYRITTKDLVDLGYLTPPKVIIKKVPGKMVVTFDWKKAKSNKAKAAYWREVEEKGIKFNEPRTKLIIDEIVKGPFPVLILVKTREQAEFICKMYMNTTNLPLPFLSGKNSSSVRKIGIQSLRDGAVRALITTTIFDQGIDIPELRKVILGSGGKSEVKAVQRIGRSLRPAEDKTEAVIIDFDDKHHSMLEKHSKARISTYKEQEFKVIYDM